MRGIERRLDKLEKRVPRPGARDTSRDHRMIFSAMDHAPNLGTSACYRKISDDGVLTENIFIDGIVDMVPKEELEAWIQTFPIEKRQVGGLLKLRPFRRAPPKEGESIGYRGEQR